jgi:outer membrane protein TolC
LGAVVLLAVAYTVLGGHTLFAQSAAVNDSATVRTRGDSIPYSYAAFIAQVLANHPVARQADLVAEDVRSQLRTAWGAFDPTIAASWDQKRFVGTGYYSYADVSLKIPTPIGSDIKIGYERAAGTYINPDRRTPDVGLLSAGISIPLGQRLLTDERRTALTQARALRDAGEADREAIVNNLVLNAARAYGSWYEAWRRREIAREGVGLAAFRLEAVQASVERGVSPAVDTLEASIEVQRREVTLREAEASFFAAELVLTAYLWDGSGRPISLAEGVRPSLEGLESGALPTVDSAAVANWLSQARASNPQLRKLDADVRSAEAQRLLAGQQFIPFAEAGVYALSERGTTPPVFDRSENESNYKGALDIKSPLLFLKERGKFGSASAKLDIRRLERERVARDVGNAVRIAANELTVLAGLLELQQRNVERTRLLRDAEQARFDNGESTLLVVNLRERAVLDESVRQAQYEARIAAARATLAVAIGNLTTLPETLGARPN